MYLSVIYKLWSYSIWNEIIFMISFTAHLEKDSSKGKVEKLMKYMYIIHAHGHEYYLDI